MNCSLEQILTLSDDQKPLFLARLIYELTISAREGYAGVNGPEDDPRLLRGINELHHVLAAELSSRLRRTTSYGDDGFLKIIRGSADAMGTAQLLASASRRALAFGQPQ